MPINCCAAWDTNIVTVGLFSNFKAIGDIYKHLRIIEPLFDALMFCRTALTDELYRDYLVSHILIQLSEIRQIVESSGETVRRADFQFMGSKNSINEILLYIETLTLETLK